MSAPAVAVRAVAGGPDLDRFIRLPWGIYRDDPQWVPPLLADVRSVLDPKHPFYQHADVQLFLAWRDGAPVGRIAAVVNRAHNDFHGDALGFFGLFECADDQEAADSLLGAAEQWLRERGRTACHGPFNLSTNDELSSPGVLVEGFDTPPAIMMSHNPPHYGRLLAESGYSGVKDLVAYWVDRVQAPPERLARALERGVQASNLTIRPLDMKRFRQEVAAIEDIYNSAWERNWGFVPMTPAEIGFMAKHLKPVVRPELCLLVYAGDQPVGFALALPDYNQALKRLDGRLLPLGVFKLLWYRRKIDAIRVITLGLKPEFRKTALDAMLMGRIFEAAVKLGMAEGECSWILEDNWAMRRGIDRIGGRVYKTYRVFGKALA
jgi:GNAT superfamily N-acetyltransferase